MKVAVIGADGQLGTDICHAFSQNRDEVVKFTIDDIDISDHDSVQAAFQHLQDVELVVNTAAFHNVPKCEEDPIQAFKVNGLGSLYLAKECSRLDIPLLHISTDYVFDGQKRQPYIETDRALPLNVYGNTKLAGEHFIGANVEKYYILRASGLYGTHPCLAKGYNFVDLMLKLAKEREEVRVVDNEVLTPTFTEDVAAQIVKMAHSRARYGLYHATAEGWCSWYEFAGEIFALAQSQVTLNRANPGEFAPAFNRPEYSVLENRALKEQEINIMPHWKEGLRRYLHKKIGIPM
jgi:dTDP-4-dehydrorhamnose reductase